ncbi:MAG: endonuclease/exonuclease/phosphatase family protein [Gammaproteobacteria bacterium]|nr:endonuclease/exonuclease/phosphatase family protein [Gammaproteobacteria bacterium]
MANLNKLLSFGRRDTGVAAPPLQAALSPAGSDIQASNNGAAACPGGLEQPGGRRVRLLSYNIQTGIATCGYHHYVTHSWKHVFPHPERVRNLNAIGRMIRGYDIVGLQEVDGGSLRSGFVNQTEYLAGMAGFACWHGQTNRDFGALAQHSIGLLSRMRPSEIVEHRLPGIIPGRGALGAWFGHGDHALVVLILHLSLGRRARLRQLGYVSEIISGAPHVVLMGDLNCGSGSQEMRWLLRNTCLRDPLPDLYTFPSWRPLHNIDHILVSPSLRVNRVEALDYPLSDHLPVAMEIELPEAVHLQPGAEVAAYGFPASMVSTAV